MTDKRKILYGLAALIIFIMFYSCSLLPGGDQDDPIDLTGFWTATWIVGDIDDGGMKLTPLYTHLEQIGSDVFMPYGFTGTVAGDTFKMSGYMYGMGDLAGTAVIEGDYISGPFEITDSKGNVTEGTSSMIRTDPALLGHMDVLGNALSTDMDFATESARAEVKYDESSGEPQTLYVGYTTAGTDIGFWIERDTASGLLGEGDFVFADGMATRVHVRYLVDGVGFDEMSTTNTLIFSGTLHISEWVVGVRFSGSIAGSEALKVNFVDLPFSTPAAF